VNETLDDAVEKRAIRNEQQQITMASGDGENITNSKTKSLTLDKEVIRKVFVGARLGLLTATRAK
jgi:F0F1-type ATP synthase assembly protein I